MPDALVAYDEKVGSGLDDQGLQQRGFDVWLRGDVLLKGLADEGNVESSAASKPSWSRW